MKKTVEKSFNSWKSTLDNIEYKDYTFDDFLIYYNQKNKVKLKNVYDIKYHETKYFMLDYEYIRCKHLLYIKTKRGSMYDHVNVSRKLNISIAEAKKIVEERKSKTSGTLQNFIKRHGEEQGKILFEEFKRKSKSTYENFVERYGENEGLDRWKTYLSSRDSDSLEYFLRKYENEEIAKLEYEKRRKKLKGKGNIQFYINRYGINEGTKRYKEICAKKQYGSTVEYYINKYGEDGVEKYLENCRKKALTLENYIKKYGEDKGYVLYEEYKNKQKLVQSLQYWIDNYENGEQLYADRYKKIYTNNSKNEFTSTEANNFFAFLEKSIGRPLQYGKRKNEKCLQYNGRNYFYDCFDEITNTLFEYNGSHIHPSPILTESERKNWVNPFNKKTYDEVKNYDELKISVAKKFGYNIIVIWDYEVKNKQNLFNKTQEIIKVIS